MAKIIAAVISLLTAVVWYATSQTVSTDTVPSSPGYESVVDDSGGCDCSSSEDYYGDQ